MGVWFFTNGGGKCQRERDGFVKLFGKAFCLDGNKREGEKTTFRNGDLEFLDLIALKFNVRIFIFQ